MFKLIGKELNAILGAQTILIWTYAGVLIMLNAVLNEIFDLLQAFSLVCATENLPKHMLWVQ